MQTGNINLANIPKNAYYASKESHKKTLSTSDHIIKKTPLTGARILADKLVSSIFIYAPKGMAGSRNSNFYEFLATGLIPNITGSAMLIALFNAANKNFKNPDRAFAAIPGRRMKYGVIFYAIGKWLGSKLINKGVQLKTGVDHEMPYKKIVKELPERTGEEPATRVEYHRVFESADFPRLDLINKMGEQAGNRYLWWDKIAKKMGYKKPLNSSDQTVLDKVREVNIKAISAKSIASYIWAALGVALAAQLPFESKISMPMCGTKKERIIGLGKNFATTLKNSFVDLYNGNNSRYTYSSKIVGRMLIFGALASVILGVYNATRGFKMAEKESDTQIDVNKEYEVM